MTSGTSGYQSVAETPRDFLNRQRNRCPNWAENWTTLPSDFARVLLSRPARVACSRRTSVKNEMSPAKTVSICFLQLFFSSLASPSLGRGEERGKASLLTLPAPPTTPNPSTRSSGLNRCSCSVLCLACLMIPCQFTFSAHARRSLQKYCSSSQTPAQKKVWGKRLIHISISPIFYSAHCDRCGVVQNNRL